MARHTRFVEAFWDADYLGMKGFDIVCRRMRDGTKVCKDIEDFMKQRSKTDADYGRAMLNLANKVKCCDETGVLGESWRMLKLQTERIAQIYEHSSLSFSNLAVSLYKFGEKQKKKKYQIEERIRNIQDTRHQLYDQTKNLQNYYLQRCKERDEIQEEMRSSKWSVKVPKRELKKIQLKSDEITSLCKIYDQWYRKSLHPLQRIGHRWEKEMEASFETFQTVEEERIEYLRDKLWKCTNVCSDACVKHDEHCELVRLTLEKCDITEDIKDFINRNKTGEIRPETLSYQPYGDEGTYATLSRAVSLAVSLADATRSTDQTQYSIARRSSVMPHFGSLRRQMFQPSSLDKGLVDIDPADNPRGIEAKFEHSHDEVLVRQAVPKRLPEKPFDMNEHLPKGFLEQRKQIICELMKNKRHAETQYDCRSVTYRRTSKFTTTPE